MPVLQNLRWWVDPTPRQGPEAMAVDEWLLETAVEPILRVYSWQGDWGSIGCFGKMADASRQIAGVEWVRRCTGGGTVDHRADWTYSLVIPRSEPLANSAGAESYRLIHLALAEVLRAEGREVCMSSGAPVESSDICFQSPVSHDLVTSGGLKVAGAGQRRTRTGLLHQGSVAAPCSSSASVQRATAFAFSLATNPAPIELTPPPAVIGSLVNSRYAAAAWLQKR